MGFLAPHRVVRPEAHVDQLRSRQHPPAVAIASQRDRPLLRVGPALVVVAELGELAVTVILAGKRHPVGAPGEHALVLHEYRGVPGPRMGISRQLGRPLHHLLSHVAVLAFQRPPLGPWLWFHAPPPFAAHAILRYRQAPRGHWTILPPAWRWPAGTARGSLRAHGRECRCVMTEAPG